MIFEKTIQNETELSDLVLELVRTIIGAASAEAMPLKIALYGDLGAGKTTFSKALCAYLGVEDTVSSPTFSLINEYALDKTAGKANRIYHMDLYRLKSAEEALDIGLLDILYSENHCLIEWPQVIEEHLPEDFVFLYIKAENTNTRHFQVFETMQNDSFSL